MNQLDERVTSLEVVQEVAKEGDVNHVLLGSFTKAGDTIRINVRLQEASTGKILTSERVEGEGESAIFPMVDDLTRRIKDKLAFREVETAVVDRDLTDITTSSVEAYRSYAAGIHLIDQGHYQEAIPLFEKAVEEDPAFAMAWAKLSVLHGNLYNIPKAREYAERALENAHRLKDRERYYIEGRYYSLQEETVLRSIEAYEKALELYPDDSASRNNVASEYSGLEQYDKAIEHYEEGIRRGTTFRATWSNLAFAYVSRGEPDKGLRLLRDYAAANPGYHEAHLYLAALFIHWGKLAEAEAELTQYQDASYGASLNPTAVGTAWWLAILRNDWEKAEAIGLRCRESNNPFLHSFFGPVLQAISRLYCGRSQEAFDIMLRSAEVPGSPLWKSTLQIITAANLLTLDEPVRALELAERAKESAQDAETQLSSLVFIALANALLHRRDESASAAAEFHRLNEKRPSPSDRRGALILDGSLAMFEGDTSTAIAKLQEAVAMLPVSLPPQNSDHVQTWYLLASAYLDAGDRAEAGRWFERIAESGALRINFPIQYIRSLYFLGKIHEEQGEAEKAREYYQRFYDYWKDGDIDRERVEDVKSKLM
jgi:tetratricopeptide (TPR) repeat protein